MRLTYRKKRASSIRQYARRTNISRLTTHPLNTKRHSVFVGDDANEASVSEYPAILQSWRNPTCLARRDVCNGGGTGRKMPRNRIRQTEAERREMEARAQTRHQYMAWAVSRGPLDYERHPLSARPILPGIVDIRPGKIPLDRWRRAFSGRLNAPFCQWANLRSTSPWFSTPRRCPSESALSEE